MLYKVATDYVSSNLDPIWFRPGDVVTLGQEDGTDPAWPDWVWCEDARGRGGWTPKQYLRSLPGSEQAEAVAPYTAAELTVPAGVNLTVVKFVNGWAWAHNQRGAWGWIPVRHLDETGLEGGAR